MKMGAADLGSFELFDPNWHLTGMERSQLEREGLEVSAFQLQMLLDFTLVYKNSRILLEDKTCFHVARCGQLSISDRCTIATSQRGLNSSSQVCQACLQRLGFNGYDMTKARREAYSHKVLETFQLSSFWKQYPMYPVSEKRDKRKSLEDGSVTK
ncbi:MAG: hypothetical protein P8X74_04295 [Reinekea sp.]